MEKTGRVLICTESFDVQSESESLRQHSQSAGALVMFTGMVRDQSEGESITKMVLEHYPGMTEKSIEEIIQQAEQRWSVMSARVIHRIGELTPGELIVFVGVTSAHRGDAFAACEFIMDYLKTQAPFWKKEYGSFGERWVEAKCSDTDAANRWS